MEYDSFSAEGTRIASDHPESDTVSVENMVAAYFGDLFMLEVVFNT